MQSLEKTVSFLLQTYSPKNKENKEFSLLRQKWNRFITELLQKNNIKPSSTVPVETASKCFPNMTHLTLKLSSTKSSVTEHLSYNRGGGAVG